MSPVGAQPSFFGEQLRLRRRQRGSSQLDLAGLARTTPRHVSFIETAQKVTISELRVELPFPMHDDTGGFLRGLAETSEANGS